FSTQAQIQQEVADFIKLTLAVYEDFGFDNIIMKLSTRPEKRVGSDESWDFAEKALADALDSSGLDWDYLPGEGAFYGPKIEFSLKDSLGRIWQCGTIQVDPNMPERLDAEFVNEQNDREVPIMLHRAILGSFERFIGILIENYAGWMPVWLAPQQVVVMNITDKQADACENVVSELKNAGLRAISDLRNEKIGFKIREKTLERIPYMLVLGDKEVESGSVNVRTREGENLGVMSVSEFITLVQTAVSKKGRQTPKTDEE
ncbi:MAG: threonine--tRNA ligase, partial [Psychrobacter sp.]